MSTFCKEYRTLEHAEKVLIEQIKAKAEELEYLFLAATNADMATARMKLEEAVMWAKKAITE